MASSLMLASHDTTTFLALKKKNKGKGKKTKHQKNPGDNHHLFHNYPKPSPTPLQLIIPSQQQQPLTRHQAIDRVLDTLQSSLARGAPADPSILSSLLETCSRSPSPHLAARLHRLIPRPLLRRSAALSSKLLRLYSLSALPDHAHQLFDQMPPPHKSHPFVWNSLLSCHADLGRFTDAIALYHQMIEDSVPPDRFTFPRVLKACAGLGSITHGEAVHRHAVRSGLATDIFVLNALVDMYAKCGDIARAQRIFNRIQYRDIVSYNAMLAGYLRHGLLIAAANTCGEMLRAGVEPDSVTVSSMLAGFSSDNKLGVQIHCWVIRRGLEWNLSVANSLIGMYSERNRLGCVRSIFEAMPEKDIVSWNAIIAAHRNDRRVLDVYRGMEDSGLRPDRITFVSLLSACANLGLVEDGRRLFQEMEEKYNLTPIREHYGCMVNLLGRAGLVEEACELICERMPFDGGPTVWGALLFACSVHGNVGIGEVAAERLFELEPDNEHNFELMMKIYRNAGREEDAEEVRSLMRSRGLDSAISGQDQLSELIDMMS